MGLPSTALMYPSPMRGEGVPGTIIYAEVPPWSGAFGGHCVPFALCEGYVVPLIYPEVYFWLDAFGGVPGAFTGLLGLVGRPYGRSPSWSRFYFVIDRTAPCYPEGSRHTAPLAWRSFLMLGRLVVCAHATTGVNVLC